ncbi:YraN family protein [Cohnella sp. REN36]|uniref:YraN family protein n=1 Tax=Cohnella sp. REN36 TaxID=2887347 RepID=UPI001D156F7D|nr:YraN family protein [Cohnella sp. REN36]
MGFGEKSAGDGRRARGIAAESAAAGHLSGLGYRIISRNWRCRIGELDLVALDGDTLVFVEVRSRRASGRFGTAVEAVTPRKCAQVRATAQAYLQRLRERDRAVRFDVVAVTFSATGELAELRHLPGAF